MSLRPLVLAIGFLGTVAAFTPTEPPPGRVDTARIVAADAEPGNWLTHGRTYTEQRYSPLGAIDTQSVKRLGLAWSYDLEMNRGAEATPLVVDGVMYVTSAWSIVHAIDARTGARRWVTVSSAIGRSSQIVDEIWAGMEPALFDKKDPRRPRDFDMRYRSDGNDLIARDRDGHEVQRVTRKQLNERLTPDLLRHIEVLERAMEINKAIWDERHPRRVLERRSKRAAENAARAMSEDLAAVLNTIERAGMWLDDHYLDVREIVNQTKARRRS